MVFLENIVVERILYLKNKFNKIFINYDSFMF